MQQTLYFIISFDKSHKSFREKNNFEKFEFLKAPYFPFSSTEIRERLKIWNREEEDKLLKEMLADSVLDYIKANRLYI